MCTKKIAATLIFFHSFFHYSSSKERHLFRWFVPSFIFFRKNTKYILPFHSILFLTNWYFFQRPWFLRSVFHSLFFNLVNGAGIGWWVKNGFSKWWSCFWLVSYKKLSQTYFANSNSNCGVIFFPDFRIV